MGDGAERQQFGYIRRLAAAVTLSAFETIQAGCAPGSSAADLLRGKCAHHWIQSADREEAFSYLTCCEVLELDPSRGRAFAARIIYGEASLGEAEAVVKSASARTGQR